MRKHDSNGQIDCTNQENIKPCNTNPLDRCGSMKDGIKILVGVDGSDHSTWGLIEAINIAKKFSGHVRVLTVYRQDKKDEAEKIQRKAKQLLEREGVGSDSSMILGSNPSLALTEMARKESFDLIIVGSRGLGSTASLLMGSVSKQVVSRAPCNVLVVKK